VNWNRENVCWRLNEDCYVYPTDDFQYKWKARFGAYKETFKTLPEAMERCESWILGNSLRVIMDVGRAKYKRIDKGLKCEWEDD